MRILVVAGEASGDAHAAPVVQLLRAQGADVVAVGGPALAATGAEMLAGIEDLAVLGFVQAARRLPRLVALARTLEARLAAERFDLFLGVDYPGFNLRFAARARRAGVPVLHYIGPQVWAWRAGRLKTLARVANHVALVLPFEKPLYDAAGIPATWVGHPLVDAAADLPESADAEDADLALFPGSRPQELASHLPLLLDTAAALRRTRKDLRVLVSRAPGAPEAPYVEALRARDFDPRSVLVPPPARLLMRRARALLVVSGTATLEAALAARPFAVVYRTPRLEWEIARRLVRVRHAALANLVAGREVVREYLQEKATVPALVAEATRLLDDEVERQRMRADFVALRRTLGPPGVAARVASIAVQLASARAA